MLVGAQLYLLLRHLFSGEVSRVTYTFSSYFHTAAADFGYFHFLQLSCDSHSPAVLSSSWETFQWPSPSASLVFRNPPLVPFHLYLLPKGLFRFKSHFWKGGFLSDVPIGSLALQVRISVTTLKTALLAKEQSSESNVLNLSSLIYEKLPWSRKATSNDYFLLHPNFNYKKF